MRPHSIDITTRLTAAVLGTVFTLCSCGGDRVTSSSGTSDNRGMFNVQPPPGARPEFSAYPVEMTAAGTVEPLAHLAPPGHTIPTDHVYIYPIDFDHSLAVHDTVVRKVFAPATGTVAFMMQPVGTDWKVEFVTTNAFGYYLDHIIPRPGLAVGQIVQAGDVIGTTNPGGSIDLGAWDLNTPVLPGFVNPLRYGMQTLHCVSPFKYFVEPLRSALYARQRRVPGVDPDPRIDQDIPGRLSGNWYEQSIATLGQETMGPAGWPRSLAFVNDNFDPSKVRVSIGGTVDGPGIWTIDDDAPRPETVSKASGKVSYRLKYTLSTQMQYGLMIVQMLADDRIQVEVFPGSQAATAEFDGKAFTYTR